MAAMFEVSAAPSVPVALAQTVQAAPRSVVLDGGPGQRRTGAQLLEESLRVAQGLSDLGVRPADRVLILSDAHPEAIIAAHAVWRIGAIAVIHDPQIPAARLQTVMADHGAVVAVADPGTVRTLTLLPAHLQPKATILVEPHRRLSARAAGVLRSAAESLAPRKVLRVALRRQRALAATRSGPCGAQSIPWRRLTRSRPLGSEHPGPGSEDLALLQYTQGPDGEPAGAMLTHANLLADAAQLPRLWGDPPTNSAPPLCTALGLHDPAGSRLALLGVLAPGIRLRRVRTPGEITRALHRRRTSVLAVPASRLERADSRPERGGPMSAIPDPVCVLVPGERIRGRAAAAEHPLRMVLARAECGFVLAGPWDPRRRDDLGNPLPGVEVDVAEDGALHVAGAQVFHGYWRRPDETALVLAGDGWVRTRDRVRTAPGGHLRAVRPSDA